MGNGNSVEGNRHFRPDRHSSIVHRARKPEGTIARSSSNSPKDVARFEGKVGANLRARDLRPQTTREPSESAHIKEQDQLSLPDLEEQLVFEATDEKPKDVLIDNSIFAQYSQTRQLLRRDVVLKEEIDKREQPDPELELDPDHVSGFIEEEIPYEMLQGKIASRTHYDRELAGDHTNDQND